MRKIDAGAVQIAYEEAGQGEPLLLIPGVFGSAVKDFACQLGPLAEHSRVVAVDPRGYGASRPPRRDFPPDFFARDAQDLANLMAALGYQRFAVAGWSDGGTVALTLAGMFPGRVTRAVTIGAGAVVTADELAILEMSRKVSRWSVESRKRVSYLGDAELEPLWNRYVDRMRGMARSGGGLCGRWLRGIACPILVIHGGADTTTSPVQARIIGEAVREAELRILPAGGHDLLRTHPDEVNWLITRFLTAETEKTRSAARENQRRSTDQHAVLKGGACSSGRRSDFRSVKARTSA